MKKPKSDNCKCECHKTYNFWRTCCGRKEQTMKLKAILQIEYEADPGWYPANLTIEEMAEIDESNFRDDPWALIELLDDEYSIKVLPA